MTISSYKCTCLMGVPANRTNISFCLETERNPDSTLVSLYIHNPADTNAAMRSKVYVCKCEVNVCAGKQNKLSSGIGMHAAASRIPERRRPCVTQELRPCKRHRNNVDYLGRGSVGCTSSARAITTTEASPQMRAMGDVVSSLLRQNCLVGRVEW